MDMRLRGKTTVDAVIRYCSGDPLQRKVLAARYERETLQLHRSRCATSIVIIRKIRDVSKIITVNTPPLESEPGTATHHKTRAGQVYGIPSSPRSLLTTPGPRLLTATALCALDPGPFSVLLAWCGAFRLALANVSGCGVYGIC